MSQPDPVSLPFTAFTDVAALSARRSTRWRPGLAAHQGLALHNEVFVADGELVAPEISSADPGSHWPHVLLMLKETAQLAAGDALTVRYAVDLAGEQPRYEFDVRRGDEALGTLRYPD